MKRDAKNISRLAGVSRREFLLDTGCAVGVLGMGTGCQTFTGKHNRPVVAFNTANLVARVSNYRFELKNWGEQHRKTVAATDAKAWAGICREIAAAKFNAVEVWEAHAAPETLKEAARAAEWKRIMADHELTPVAYAGRLSAETLQICQWLGIPHVDGSTGGLQPDAATDLCRKFGVRFNVENHPEKSLAEIMGPIGGGNEWLGVCIDTGWLGTQGAPGPAIIRGCGKYVRHTHIKDVKAVGRHETCPLGEGIADVEGCLAALKEIGYTGAYAWEDEPEDRNPLDSAVRNRQWIEARV